MKQKFYRLVFVFCVLIFGFISGCQNKQLYKDTRILMGTFIEVISPEKKAASIVFDEIRRIDNLLSKYNPDSEVSRLNKLGGLKVSADTFFVIKKSVEFWHKTDGAFDITVSPLTALWGFADREFSVPSEEEISAALKLVGSDKIILNESDNMVKFIVSAMKIDLGGIAKGYALDCAAKKLRENNIRSCLINAGGQVYCLGNRFGRPWRVAVKNPREDSALKDYLELEDKSVSTSGDYEQFFVKGKRRYVHILNPWTGYPAAAGVVSVTVVADDGLTADALSTAIFVLGKDRAKTIIEKFPGVKVRIIEEKDVSHNK